jgi:uncharacterized protein YcbX
MSEFTIAQLWIYPVKSLGGMPVDAAPITPAGSLAGDREWIVVRPDGAMLWQGDIPRMTLLSARLDPDGLEIVAPDGALLRLERDHAGADLAVRQYGYQLAGTDAGDVAAAWLSAQLGTQCRLVRVGAGAHRWPGLNPVHVISVHSLAALNARLAGQGDAAIEPERFRPNVLLAGTHAAFAEEAMATIALADGTALVLREPCKRCELPNISRIDASRGKQPLKLIGGMAKGRPTAGPASFGIYATARGVTLRTGAAVML